VRNSLLFCRKRTIWWLVASVAWIALILWRAVGQAPVLPLDVNGGNPEVKAVFDAAVTRHYLRTGLLALGVPLVAYGLGCLLCRFRRGPSAVVTATDHPDGGPSRILLMRHAEKTGDPEDIHLSAEGVKRSARLATYIPQTFGKPDFVFAAARSKRSIGSIETVEPLAAAVGKTVQHDIEDRDFQQLVSEIFSNPDYRGKTIVVCWHHKKLPEIAAALGAAPGSYPSSWSEDVYNLIPDFRYDAKSDAPPTVTNVVEPF
jgi:hypothetical protein